MTTVHTPIYEPTNCTVVHRVQQTHTLYSPWIRQRTTISHCHTIWQQFMNKTASLRMANWLVAFIVISWTYFGHIWKYLRYILKISWTYLGHNIWEFLTYLGISTDALLLQKIFLLNTVLSGPAGRHHFLHKLNTDLQSCVTPTGVWKSVLWAWIWSVCHLPQHFFVHNDPEKIRNYILLQAEDQE